jgi:cysteine-rich repeat protein
MRRTVFVSLLVLTTLGARPSLATVASDICSPSANPCVVSTTKGVTPGSILDFGSRALDVQNKGKLIVGSGLMTILAGSVRVESGGDLLGSTTQDTGASIKVMTSGDIRIETGGNGDGTVDVSAGLNPGEIDLIAHGNVVVNGSLDANALNNQGSGGVINVSADGNVSIAGPIGAKAGLLGLGGEITAQAGGTLTTSALIRADGGDGGDIELDSQNGDVTTGADVNAGAGGTYGDGGTVTVLAGRNATVNGNFLLPAAGSDIEGGGTGGDVDIEGTAGTVAINGDVDSSGASPDGDAGEVDIVAGLDYTQAGTIFDQGKGGDSCGGFLLADVGRAFSLSGNIDVSGGFCGGDLEVDSASAALGAASEMSADAAQYAGSVEIFAQQITSSGKLHATASATDGTAGIVQLAGCTLSVPSGASIKSDGVNGENLLQASGQLTIGGALSSRPSGHNRFEFRDSTKPPIIQGSATIQPVQDCAPAKGCLTTTLPVCATLATCGNNVVEPGEECDDGNTTPCDGCSPTCQMERCGNGAIECHEECDDGASNGAPGDPCDATCHAVQGGTTLFIPGAKHGYSGCMLEWALQTAPVAGFPDSTQTCIDGDPACDQDGNTDGVCTFVARACLNVTDARLPKCPPHFVVDLNMRRPSPTRPVDQTEADNAQQLLTALEGLSTTVRSGDTTFQQGPAVSARDHCSQTFVQRVPHAEGATGRRLLSATSTASVGDRNSNRIALACAPNPSVCGNGVVEVTEQCDDGNTVGCDGCSPRCRREVCGNRVIDCGEQCDDGPLNGQAGDPCSARCT